MSKGEYHDKMVTMLAKRYMEEYRLGGPKRAAAFVKRGNLGDDPVLKKLLNNKVKTLIKEATDR